MHLWVLPDVCPICSLLLFVDEADAFLRKRATVSTGQGPPEPLGLKGRLYPWVGARPKFLEPLPSASWEGDWHPLLWLGLGGLWSTCSQVLALIWAQLLGSQAP